MVAPVIELGCPWHMYRRTTLELLTLLRYIMAEHGAAWLCAAVKRVGYMPVSLVRDERSVPVVPSVWYVESGNYGRLDAQLRLMDVYPRASLLAVLRGAVPANGKHEAAAAAAAAAPGNNPQRLAHKQDTQVVYRLSYTADNVPYLHCSAWPCSAGIVVADLLCAPIVSLESSMTFSRPDNASTVTIIVRYGDPSTLFMISLCAFEQVGVVRLAWISNLLAALMDYRGRALTFRPSNEWDATDGRGIPAQMQPSASVHNLCRAISVDRTFFYDKSFSSIGSVLQRHELYTTMWYMVDMVHDLTPMYSWDCPYAMTT